MQFPGENYLVYAQDPAGCDAPLYRDAGIDRFIFTEDSLDHLREKDVFALMKTFGGADVPFEMVFALDVHATRITYARGEYKRTEHPVWQLGRDDIKLLEKMVVENDLVFVENTLVVNLLGEHSEKSVMFRELWEVVQQPRAARMIIFGRFMREAFYAFGLEGGAVRIRNKDRVQFSAIYGPDSASHRYPHSKSLINHPLTGDSEFRGMVPYAAMKFLQHIPIAFAETYADVSRHEWQPRTRPEWADKKVQELLVRPSRMKVKFLHGDRRLCDTCSVKYACRLYKERSVCIMPGSDGKRLADFFSTRNSTDVIDGIGAILQHQANRLESMVEDEAQAREIAETAHQPFVRDPEVSKAMNDVQRNAERYAKLLNPMLTKPQVAVQINSGNGGQVQISPADVTPLERANAVRELEARGHARQDLTPQMILNHIAESQGGKVVEGEIINGFKNDF